MEKPHRSIKYYLKYYKDMFFPRKFSAIANTIVSKKDKRDFLCKELKEGISVLPTECLIQNLPTIRQQGALSSCMSHAAIGAYEIQLTKRRFIEGSELFHYYNARKYVFKTFPSLTGMTIRDGCKTLLNWGYAFECLWGYNASKVNVEPSALAYSFSKLYKIDRYERLTNLDQIKVSLLQNIPVICGIFVNPAFGRLNQENYVYDPIKREGGGHAVIIVGYNDAEQTFTIRNSWGKRFGNKGYFEMTYKSFKNTSFDWFRIIKKRW